MKSRTRPGDPAAVVGVVLAGVVAMVVTTGPFDWWATMVGLTLLAVLWGYAHEPQSPQESAGLAAAIALALIYTVGAPLEIWFNAGISGEGENGNVVLLLWAIAAVSAWGLLELRRARTHAAAAGIAEAAPTSNSADLELGGPAGGPHPDEPPQGSVSPSTLSPRMPR